jgi:hypothetical protein
MYQIMEINKQESLYEKKHTPHVIPAESGIQTPSSRKRGTMKSLLVSGSNPE